MPQRVARTAPGCLRHVLAVAVFLLSASKPNFGQSQVSVSSGQFTFKAAPVASNGLLGDIFYAPAGQAPAPLLHLKLNGQSRLVLKSATQDAKKQAVFFTFTGADGAQVNLSVGMTSGTKNVRVGIRSNTPGVTLLDPGQWDPSLNANNIKVPYYSDTVSYSPVLRQFLGVAWDLHQSQSTNLKGRAVSYEQRTDNSLLPIHEDLLLTVSDNVDDVLPLIGNPSSPLIQQLSGMMVVDVWERNFADIRRGLDRLADYGIGNCIVIVHAWQNAGYDNGLPQHMPANVSYGGDAGLQAVSASAARAGCRFGLHENYTDYYPNYSGFNPSDVALQKNGTEVLGWLNGLKVQAVEARPDRMVAIAQTQSPAIHSRYNTSASFLDVNSAIPPWRKIDRNIDAPYAGSVQGWVTGASALWSFERTTHKGPIFGEGGAHWYYSGYLDGVEAQLGFGPVATNLGENLPLFVDFDLLRIHPLQANHGQGYYERWTTSKKASLTQDEMDAYRMQEIAFGHAPYVGRPIWSDGYHAFEEQNLVGPVASRYGASNVSALRYEANGQWMTPSGAAIANNFEQPEITYQDGLTVIANAGPNSISWHGLNIPHRGWAALAPDLVAYTAQCGANLCSYAQTPATLFADPRTPLDKPLSGGGLAAPRVQSATMNGQSLVLQLGWSVNSTPTSDLSEFIHIVNDSPAAKNGGIVAQNDHAALPTNVWRPGAKLTEPPVTIPVPPTLAPGTYSVRVGLVASAGKARVSLDGDDDGSQRYTLGTLTVGQGGSASFQQPASTMAVNANFAPTPQRIGIVTTDGMISLRQIQGKWVLMPFSRDRTVTVSFDSAALAMPQQLMSETNGPIQPSSDGTHWTVQMKGSRSYSWPVAGQLPISVR